MNLGIMGFRFLLSDVKPSNVLINTLGQVKMCDFGISGYLVDSVAKTIDAGCKPYMAVSTPEWGGEGGIQSGNAHASKPCQEIGNRWPQREDGNVLTVQEIFPVLFFFLNIFCLKSLVICFIHTIFFFFLIKLK